MIACLGHFWVCFLLNLRHCQALGGDFPLPIPSAVQAILLPPCCFCLNVWGQLKHTSAGHWREGNKWKKATYSKASDKATHANGSKPLLEQNKASLPQAPNNWWILYRKIYFTVCVCGGDLSFVFPVSFIISRLSLLPFETKISLISLNQRARQKINKYWWILMNVFVLVFNIIMNRTLSSVISFVNKQLHIC